MLVIDQIQYLLYFCQTYINIYHPLPDILDIEKTQGRNRPLANLKATLEWKEA